MGSQTSMSLYEVLDLLAQNSDKIDVLWNFFVGVHLAVLGGLIVMPTRVQWFEKLLAIVGYCAFNYLNHNALVDTYSYHLALLDEIRHMSVSASDVGHIVTNHLNQFDLRDRIVFLHYTHVAATAVVVGAITFANRFVQTE